jgi:hypothetical protein
MPSSLGAAFLPPVSVGSRQDITADGRSHGLAKKQLLPSPSKELSS